MNTRMTQGAATAEPSYASDIDASQADSLTVEVDPAIAPLVPDYLEHRYVDVSVLLHALDGDDLDTIWEIGLDLAASGVSYGFDGITDLGVELQEAALDDDPRRAGEATRELESYLDCVSWRAAPES